ncbi:hypothetical protein, partial [Frankia nepalensis]
RALWISAFCRALWISAFCRALWISAFCRALVWVRPAAVAWTLTGASPRPQSRHRRCSESDERQGTTGGRGAVRCRAVDEHAVLCIELRARVRVRS